MSGIRPFEGQVVRQVAAHDVVSPAYDALTIEQRRRFRQDHPDSYLHVTRSAADEPDGDTVDNKTLVARGRAALEDLVAKDLFDTSDTPAFYVYRLRSGAHSQLGLVCEVSSEYFAAAAKPHEATQPKRAELLAEHFLTVRAASSPIACAVQDSGALEAALAEGAQGEPQLVITTDDGLQQSVWRVESDELAERLARLVEGVELYIIDGHHRAAANKYLVEEGLATFPVLAAIFPEQSLYLVGFHRMLRLPATLAPEEFVAQVRRRFTVHATSDVAAIEPGRVAMVVDQEWLVVDFDERPTAGDAVIQLGSLDPVVLEREILQAIVGRHGAIDVTFVPDTEPFRSIVEHAERQGRIPVFVPPVAIADMMSVARGGLIMPAKSTYFMPKVRSGIFLRLL